MSSTGEASDSCSMWTSVVAGTSISVVVSVVAAGVSSVVAGVSATRTSFTSSATEIYEGVEAVEVHP
jgi:hypothetical protein